jgi:hypothetical protein
MRLRQEKDLQASGSHPPTSRRDVTAKPKRTISFVEDPHRVNSRSRFGYYNDVDLLALYSELDEKFNATMVAPEKT